METSTFVSLITRWKQNWEAGIFYAKYNEDWEIKTRDAAKSIMSSMKNSVNNIKVDEGVNGAASDDLKIDVASMSRANQLSKGAGINSGDLERQLQRQLQQEEGRSAELQRKLAKLQEDFLALAGKNSAAGKMENERLTKAEEEARNLRHTNEELRRKLHSQEQMWQ